MKILFVLLAILAGSLIGMQGPINSSLGSKIGLIEAALFNFLVGGLVLAINVAVWGKGSIFLAKEAAWWQLTGGLLGATFVFSSIFIIPKLGAAVTMLSVIAGQMTISLIADHFGLFGLRQMPINYYRLSGVVLLFCSLYFIFKGTAR
ncbi:MAG: bacterial/archaeal transporter family-2 protein [Clostridia bacterium]|nr:bacterial/archaeal transporter family-2 protein [Clostridia bacterium]